MKQLITLIFLFLMTLVQVPLQAGEKFELARYHSGSIRIHSFSESDKKEAIIPHRSPSLYPVFSQIGTSVSLFTTSILFATGYSEEKFVSDFGTQFNLDSSHGQREGIFAGEILLLLGALTASLFNYNLGFDNDLLAIIPILPVQVSAGNINTLSDGNDKLYSVQYGFYFYFSRDF